MSENRKRFGTIATRDLEDFQEYRSKKSGRVNGRGNLNIAHHNLLDTLDAFNDFCRAIRGNGRVRERLG